MNAENGLWTPTRKHELSYYREGANVKGKWMASGYYNDWGFCGVSDFYHWDITSDPRFLTNPEWQLEKCLELFEGGTTFYGRIRIQTDADFNKKTEAQFILL